MGGALFGSIAIQLGPREPCSAAEWITVSRTRGAILDSKCDSLEQPNSCHNHGLWHDACSCCDFSSQHPTWFSNSLANSTRMGNLVLRILNGSQAGWLSSANDRADHFTTDIGQSESPAVVDIS